MGESSGEVGGVIPSRFQLGVLKIPPGTESWTVPVGGVPLDIRTTPAADGIAVAGTVPGKGGFLSFHQRDGTVLWRHETRESVTALAMSRDGETLLAGSDDNHLHCLDRKGRLLWNHKLDNRPRALALSLNGNLAAAGGDDRHVHFFDRSRPLKKFVWKYRMGGEVLSVDMPSSGQVVAAGAADGEFVLLDHTGQPLWSHMMEGGVTRVAVSATGDRMVAASSSGHVVAFGRGGQMTWKAVCPAPCSALLLSGAGDTVAVACGGTVALLGAGGAVLWQVEMDSPVAALRAGENLDLILVHTRSRRVHCLDLKGDLVWGLAVGEPRASTISRDGEIALVGDTAGLSAFEPAKVMRALIAQSQSMIEGARNAGLAVVEANRLLRDAVMVLGQRNYPQVADALAQVEASLRFSEVARREMEAKKAEVEAAVAEAEKHIRHLEIQEAALKGETAGAADTGDMARLRDELGNARAMMGDGRFVDALAAVRAFSTRTEALRGAHARRAEVAHAINTSRARVEELRRMDVDVAAADDILARAQEALQAGKNDEAMVMADSALKSAAAARRKSRKAMEHELSRAASHLLKERLTADDCREIEALAETAVPFFDSARDFIHLAEAHERLGTYWRRRADLGLRDADALSGEAFTSAVWAYWDAGRRDLAADLLERSGAHGDAARLYLAANDPAGAARCWKEVEREAEVERRMKEQTRNDLVRDRLSAAIAAGRFAEAGVVLVGEGFPEEALRFFERVPGRKEEISSVVLLHSMFQFDRIHHRLIGMVSAAGDEFMIERKAGPLALWGLLGAGALFVSRVTGQDAEKALHAFRQAVSEYRRGLEKGIFPPNEDLDLCLLHQYLSEGDIERSGSLARLRSGPFWEGVGHMAAAWKERDAAAFRSALAEMAASVRSPLLPGQALPRGAINLASEDSCIAALRALLPFTLDWQAYRSLARLAEPDHLRDLKSSADAALARGRYEEARNGYQEVLSRDNFIFVDPAELHLCLSGACLMLGEEETGLKHLSFTGLSTDDAIERMKKVPGLERAGRRARGAGGGLVCGHCGQGLPAGAKRCFRCGEQALLLPAPTRGGL